MTSIDDLEQLIADNRIRQRELEWDLVDIIGGSMQDMIDWGSTITAAANVIAAAAGQSAAWAKQRYAMWRVYDEDLRYPAVDLHLYRIALSADDPEEAINLAADEEWSSKELQAWIDQQKNRDRREKTRIELRGVMHWGDGATLEIKPESRSFDVLKVPDGLLDVPIRAVITGE